MRRAHRVPELGPQPLERSRIRRASLSREPSAATAFARGSLLLWSDPPLNDLLCPTSKHRDLRKGHPRLAQTVHLCSTPSVISLRITNRDSRLAACRAVA